MCGGLVCSGIKGTKKRQDCYAAKSAFIELVCAVKNVWAETRAI